MGTLTWPEKLLEAMLNTDSAGAAAIIGQALAEGLSPDRVIAEILEPSLAEVGRAWEGRTASLAQIFVAGRIAEGALQRCLPPGGSVQPSKGRAVIGNIEEDFHGLG